MGGHIIYNMKDNKEDYISLSYQLNQLDALMC